MDRVHSDSILEYEERMRDLPERRRLLHRVFDLQQELIVARRAVLDYFLDREERSELKRKDDLYLDLPTSWS